MSRRAWLRARKELRQTMADRADLERRLARDLAQTQKRERAEARAAAGAAYRAQLAAEDQPEPEQPLGRVQTAIKELLT